MLRRRLAALVLSALAGVASAAEFRDLGYDPSPTPHPARRLDLYTPASASDSALPVVVYVHGGGWFAGSKERVGRKAEWLAAQGFVLASIDYRLAPEVRHPAASEDLALALAWLRDHVAEYGGDPARIFLLGHSSGGYLAALAATDGRFLAPHRLAPGSLAGVICLDTNSFDLASLIPRLEPEPAQLYREIFGDDPATWREASPMAHVVPGLRLPPFLLLVAGTGGSTHQQSGRFARRLRQAGVAASVVVLPEETHGSINATLGDPGRRATAVVARFLALPGRL